MIPKSSEKLLKFLIDNLDENNLFDNIDLLKSRFPSFNNDIQILISERLVSAQYYDDEIYFINVLPKGLLYKFDKQSQSLNSTKNNLIYPLIVAIIAAILALIY